MKGQLNLHYRPDEGVHSITRYSLPNFGVHTRIRHSDSIIAHLDIDAFYAQVEQHDFGLFGIPVVIGSWHDDRGRPRGIVATASYEARRFGVRTGMSFREALRHCPHLVAFRIDYEKYRTISHDIHQALQLEFPCVERFSMDEYFIELPVPVTAPREIQEPWVTRIRDTLRKTASLDGSIGIARSKSHAKLVSDHHKPGGTTWALSDAEIRDIIDPCPLSRVCGIGTKRAERLKPFGLRTIGDARDRGSRPFESVFGPHLGRVIWLAATGLEQSPVWECDPDPQQFHHIHTFPEPTTDESVLHGELAVASRSVTYRMRAYGVKCRHWELYLRFDETQWEGVPFAVRLPAPTFCDSTILGFAWQKTWPIASRFISLGRRILGIGITALDPENAGQMEWDWHRPKESEALYRTMDSVNHEFGAHTVQLARAHAAQKGRVHFR